MEKSLEKLRSELQDVLVFTGIILAGWNHAPPEPK
jgi:predicted MPP superfamily phosphohydrolase